MEKKTKKGILVAISVLVVATLVLLGLTYAYYRTKVYGNLSEDPSISVTSKKLEIRYADGSAYFIPASTNVEQEVTDGIIKGIEPGDSFKKIFSVKNTGTELVEDYIVFMEDVVNTFENYNDIQITLECNKTTVDEEGNSVSAGTCNGIAEADGRYYPKTNEMLVLNDINVGETHNYTLTVTYVETNEDQSIDMGKTLEGKLQIYDKSEKTLWYREGDQIKSLTSDTVYTIGDKVTYADTGLKAGKTVSIDSLYDANDTYKEQHFILGGINADLTAGTLSRTDFEWIVMGIKDSETLLITTPDMYRITLRIVMDNATPINVIDEQFSYASIFMDNIIKAVYGEEARSIKASDVNNVLNYEPTGGVTYNGEGETVISLNNFDTKVKDIPAAAYSSVLEKALPVYFNNGTCTNKATCTFDFDNHIVNGYYYNIGITSKVMKPVVDPTKNVTDLEMEVLYPTAIAESGASGYGYWLNDLGLRISDSSKLYYGFGAVWIQNGSLKIMLPINLVVSNETGTSQYKALRPVIEIKDQELTKVS